MPSRKQDIPRHNEVKSTSLTYWKKPAGEADPQNRSGNDCKTLTKKNNKINLEHD